MAPEVLVRKGQTRPGLNSVRATVSEKIGGTRRRLVALSIGLNWSRVPPPILWTQNPCFLEFTDRVALQNIENKEVPCKIFLDKELRSVSASTGRFRLKAARRGRAGTMI